MDLRIAAVHQIIRTYQTQNRIAELNKSNEIKVVQGQVDRVSLSSEAQRLFESQPASDQDETGLSD